MKKVLLITLLTVSYLSHAQAYSGKGDKKFQVGANVQNGGTGIFGSADFGLGENISFGFTATYLLSSDDLVIINNQGLPENDEPNFIDKFDARARFNANLGNVIGLPESMDVYPGLSLGLRNFGTHLGFRYFFTNGFGLFSEVGVPITKYGGKPNGVEVYNNQFAFNVGASFNF